jgi:hypothetical protein
MVRAWERRGMHTEFRWENQERPLGTLKGRCENGIKMDLKEIGWRGMDPIHLAQDRDQWQPLVNTVTNFLVP